MAARREFHQEVAEECKNFLVEERWQNGRLANLSLQCVE